VSAQAGTEHERTPGAPVDPSEWTVADLRKHLEAAVQLELTTIPPYLTALFSLHGDGNLEPALLIRSVVLEEMLHMTLAANVLNAVGGRPRITGEHAPRYPAKLPYHDPEWFHVGIRPLDDEALRTFLAIENPTYPLAAPPPAAAADARGPLVAQLAEEHGYKTIGEFYGAVEKALRALDRHGDIFTGDPTRQVRPEHYYAGGGEVIVVDCLDHALDALQQIVEQGEGELTSPPADEKFDPEGDLAHYYRFNELQVGKRYRKEDKPAEPTGRRFDLDRTAIYPMQPDWRPGAQDGELGELSAAFDRIYGRLLDQLQVALDGRPGELTVAVGTMWELKVAALDLLRIPLAGDSGLHAGPTFRYPVPD
jgi:hypothetical protein